MACMSAIRPGAAPPDVRRKLPLECEAFHANGCLRASLRTDTIGQLQPSMPKENHAGNDRSQVRSRHSLSSQPECRNLQSGRTKSCDHSHWKVDRTSAGTGIEVAHRP